MTGRVNRMRSRVVVPRKGTTATELVDMLLQHLREMNDGGEPTALIARWATLYTETGAKLARLAAVRVGLAEKGTRVRKKRRGTFEAFERENDQPIGAIADEDT